MCFLQSVPDCEQRTWTCCGDSCVKFPAFVTSYRMIVEKLILLVPVVGLEPTRLFTVPGF